MKRHSVILLLLAASMLVAVSSPAQNPGQRLELDRKGETIVLEPYAPNILRVTLSLKKEPAVAAPGYGLIASPDAAGWTARSDRESRRYKSSQLVVTVDRERLLRLRLCRTEDRYRQILQWFDAGRAHHFPDARREKAAGDDGLVAVGSESQGRDCSLAERPPTQRSGVLCGGRNLRFARRRALLRARREPGRISRSSRACGALLARLHVRRRRPTSAACRFWSRTKGTGWCGTTHRRRPSSRDSTNRHAGFSEVGDRVSFFVIAGSDSRRNLCRLPAADRADADAAQGGLWIHPMQAALRKPG